MSTIDKEMETTQRMFAAMQKVCQAAAALVVFMDSHGYHELGVVKNLRTLLIECDQAEREFQDMAVSPPSGQASS